MQANQTQATQEERMLSVASCITAHIGFGLVPGVIYFVKKGESRFVAYYASLAAMTGGAFLLSILLFVVGGILGAALSFGGALSNSPVGGLFSLIGILITIIEWPLIILAFPVMIAVMFMSAISAWNQRYIELPVLSKLARKFAGL